MPADTTPMMRQYKKIKEQTAGCLLFFRLGDFYEMFDDDAITASRELDLTLTTRDRGKDEEERTPMCGVPYHSVEPYIAKLLAKGYKVAICEQTEDPALAKGLVSRDVVRIITPGTVVESSMLDERRQNYICSCFIESGGGAVCFADISTGEVILADFEGEDAAGHILSELVRYSPAEVILSADTGLYEPVSKFLNDRINCPVQVSDSFFDNERAHALFEKRFGASEMDKIRGNIPAIRAAGALLAYLSETQKKEDVPLSKLTRYSAGSYMELDYQTRRNLELTETIRERDKRGSLLWVLDRTKTAMGGRTLRSWLEKPLLSPAAVKRRLNAVAELFSAPVARGEITEVLRGVGDMERLIGRLVLGSGNCRDLRGLADSASNLPMIVSLLSDMRCAVLSRAAGMDTLSDIAGAINAAISDNPPFSVRDGGLIREGYDPEVDRLRALTTSAKDAVAAVETAERERTGIKKLKIGYNKVFGYYIEMPRSQSESVPDHYIRKQTLVNCERYITEELKNLESELLTAHDRLTDLEYRIFSSMRDLAASAAERIRTSASIVGELDALCSLAETASRNNYSMPEVDVSETIDIIDGRHPVVERAQNDVLFVPNDTSIGSDECRVAIITGPNMAGKSTYMRQTALIVLMAQIGSFVPARSAHIGIVDRIFTRIGASDDLFAGQSTFMVEMTEVAQILRSATRSSLLILDEIGRGTSTFDGMAIARAVLEFCADSRTLGAKTMFATHYHELTELADILPGVKNFSTAVKKRGDDVIFLRRIIPGGADRSYGVEVAKLAGVPDSVIRRSRAVLKTLESGAPERVRVSKEPGEDSQLSFDDAAGRAVREKLLSCDLNTLTPLEAMNLLFELKKELG